MHVLFDIGGPVRVTKIVIATVGDESWEIDAGPGTDFRAVRGMDVKPVVNGTWPVTLTATDVNGCTATATAPNSVTVIVGG